VLKISQEESKYQRVALAPTQDPPMIYYLFWANVSPKLIQEYGMNFSPEVVKNNPLDKYKVVEWPRDISLEPDVARYLKPDTLYFVSQNEFQKDLRDKTQLPKGVKLVDLIAYPDNEIAFYLITREQEYQPPVKEPKYDIKFL